MYIRKSAIPQGDCTPSNPGKCILRPNPMTSGKIWLLILGLSTLSLAETDVLGTAVDATSDLPIPKVRVFSADSSFLGSSDDQGRFELRLARPIEVTFRREGYRDKVVELTDVSDLLDFSVELDPLGTALEGRTVTSHNATAHAPVGSIAELESVEGMRMDLQDHLRNLPGVSGVREFSSEISVYGSRTADVTQVLGTFVIPNLRHLDYSFPGNQSVLNPRMLQGVTVESDPTSGPLEQGLASALHFQPLRPPTDMQSLILSWGLVNRELDVFGPVGNGSYAISGRYLEPSLMNHLTSRFFVGSPNVAPAQQVNATAVAPATSQLNLSAYDAYARVEQGFGPLAGSLTALGSSDDYSVSVYAHTVDGSGNVNQAYVPVEQGTKTDGISFADVQGQTAWGWLDGYGGIVAGSEVQQLSDTAQRNQNAGAAQMAAWAAWTQTRTDSRGGFTLEPTWDFFGLDPEFLGAYDYIDDSRSFGEYFKQGLGQGIDDNRSAFGGRAQTDDLAYSRLHGMFRLRHKSDQDSSRWGISVGDLWSQGAGNGAEGTLSWMAPLLGIGWTANLSERQSEYVEADSFARLGTKLTSATEVKLGAGKMLGPVEVTSAVYWRDLQNPELPQANFLWLLPESRKANSATVWGGTMQAKWTAWHTIQIESNFSRVQGTYQMADGGTMDWEANRDFDSWTVIKYHPRSDTLFSIILSHAASFGKPEYLFHIDTAAHTLAVGIDPAYIADKEFGDQFRTDARVELDIPTNLAPIRDIRFYAEVQNIFGQFSDPWAHYLGGDNFRARSWSPIRADPYQSASSIVGAQPLYARGTDLLVTFGIEGRLGI
jgi:hypothetical protein